MPYSQLPDEFCDDPRILQVGPLASWLHVCAWAYCGRLMTDGFLPAPQVRRLADLDQVDALVAALVRAGLWREREGGYWLPDFLEHNRTREQIMAERGAREVRKALYDDPSVVQRVKARDQDRCRYCGVTVRWHDRRGPSGGTLDHVVPMEGTKSNLAPIYNDPDNVVVACRACNARKGRRTPEQAGMTLLPPPGVQVGQNGTKSDLDPAIQIFSVHPSHPTHDSSSPYGEEAPAAPDAPTPAVRKPRQARDTISPPTTRAVQFANQHLHMRCDEAQREAINEVVPDTPEDAHHWEDCLKEWRVRYPHNKGLAGPLDWFRDGIPPRGHPMAARGGTSPPNTPMGRLQTVMDWEEGRNGALAPAEARKALTGWT